MKTIQTYLVQPRFCLFVFTIFLSALANDLFSQEITISNSIFFENNSHELDENDRHILTSIIDSLHNSHARKVIISGNTDYNGTDNYNLNLSQKRVDEVILFLKSNGLYFDNISMEKNGESSPIADNSTPVGRAQNRRVDIFISAIKNAPMPDYVTEETPPPSSIFALYKILEKPSATFLINSKRDTFLNCPEGTIVLVKANSFQIPEECSQENITIQIKEVYKYADMLAENLSTIAGERLLETHGMLKTVAQDCKGDTAKLHSDGGLVVFVPNDKYPDNLSIFEGKTIENNVIDWIEDKTVSSSFIGSNMFLGNLFGGPILNGRCPLFFCGILNLFSPNRRRQMFAQTNYFGSELLEIQQKYGINDLQKLAAAMGIDERDISAEQIILENKKQIISTGEATVNDLNYIVFNTSKMGWRNCDVFMNMEQEMLTAVKVDLQPESNIDCKLVFKNKKALIYPSRNQKSFEFNNIPKNETAWLVVLKYENGAPFISMQKVKIGDQIIQPKSFEQVTFDELKSQLKVLDI